MNDKLETIDALLEASDIAIESAHDLDHYVARAQRTDRLRSPHAVWINRPNRHPQPVSITQQLFIDQAFAMFKSLRRTDKLAA